MNGRQMLLFVTAVFFFGLTGLVPTAWCQSRLAIDEAKSKLEQLQSQLLRVENEARNEKEKTMAEQVDTTPKGEFETTKEYEARQAKTSELEQQIADRIDRKKEARKQGLNRLINEVLTMEFILPLEARLGVYDADSQIFPLLLLPANQESMFVPRAEAKLLKENFPQAEKIGTFGLQLDAQNHAKEYLVSGKVTYEGGIYLIENRQINVARAMFMLYGNYDPVNNHAKWRGEAGWEEPEGEYEAIPIFNKSFRENNTNKFILVTGSDLGVCHGCGVKMGIAVFFQNGSMWEMELGQKDVGTYGESGNPPKASVVKIGTDRYALMFSSFWTNGGGDGVLVDFIDRVNGIFKEIFSLATREVRLSLDDLHGPWKIETSNTSKMEYIPSIHSSYFDIKVITRGKRRAKVRGNLLQPFVDVKIYRFSDGAYKLSE